MIRSIKIIIPRKGPKINKSLKPASCWEYFCSPNGGGFKLQSHKNLWVLVSFRGRLSTQSYRNRILGGKLEQPIKSGRQLL